MKARDIIPGWPRGRSTSALLWNRDDLAWIQWQIMRIGESWDGVMMLADFERNIEYHEAQQCMIDRYFQEIYRPQDTPPLSVYGQQIRPVRIAQ